MRSHHPSHHTPRDTPIHRHSTHTVLLRARIYAFHLLLYSATGETRGEREGEKMECRSFPTGFHASRCRAKAVFVPIHTHLRTHITHFARRLFYPSLFPESLFAPRAVYRALSLSVGVGERGRETRGETRGETSEGTVHQSVSSLRKNLESEFRRPFPLGRSGKRIHYPSLLFLLSVDCSKSTLRLFRDAVLHVSSGLDLFGTTVLYHDSSVSSRRRVPPRDMSYSTLFLTEILFLFLSWVFVEYGSASGEERRGEREGKNDNNDVLRAATTTTTTRIGRYSSSLPFPLSSPLVPRALVNRYSSSPDHDTHS
jgi:hypothetical protein